jgi:RNA polymerase sigma-70 factor (ECF subfamily)
MHGSAGRQAAAAVDATSEPPTFEGVYRSEIGYVLNSLRRLGVSEAELEDVAHDVFVAVHRHFAEYDGARPVRPWLFAFVYRIARDHRRLARHHREVGAIEHESASLEPLPDEAVDDERLRAALLGALEALDFDKRSLIVMHDIDGMPVTEIARLLEVPLNTAYSRVRLARAALEKQLEHTGRRR